MSADHVRDLHCPSFSSPSLFRVLPRARLWSEPPSVPLLSSLKRRSGVHDSALQDLAQIRSCRRGAQVPLSFSMCASTGKRHSLPEIWTIPQNFQLIATTVHRDASQQLRVLASVVGLPQPPTSFICPLTATSSDPLPSTQPLTHVRLLLYILALLLARLTFDCERSVHVSESRDEVRRGLAIAASMSKFTCTRQVDPSACRGM